LAWHDSLDQISSNVAFDDHSMKGAFFCLYIDCDIDLELSAKKFDIQLFFSPTNKENVKFCDGKTSFHDYMNSHKGTVS
jgi:hypothetical protein